ncbi:MAG: ice-binding family protein [Minisyncoccota bacterium]
MKNLKKISIIALTVVCTLGLAELVMAATTVSLGTADSFAVLAGSGITVTTPSVISGDVGLSPAGGTSYTGLTTAMVTGTIYAVDGTGPTGSVNDPALLTAAKNGLTTAYNTAASTTPTTTYAPIYDLGGQTLTPGVYNDPSSLAITGTTTLDAQGNSNAVFIFQAGSTLTTASNSHVILINGAQACNVFWQVGSSATLGTGSHFKGNILAYSSITDNGGSIIEGRLLAENGAVTLNNTNLVKATCVGPAAVAFAGAGAGADYWSTLPLIDVTKIPSPLALPGGPGPVTYTYTVTNVGKVPLNTVWVKDNKCSPVQYVSGDTNGNGLLDLTETWTYRCTKTVSQTETNTATAHGYSAGADVYATANATVVVGLPITPPLIHIVKTPSVSVLPAHGGWVTYTYKITNPGTAPLSDVSITDNKCTGLPGLVSGNPGDLNKNNLLDSNETWTFTCKSYLTHTTTNIGTAEGSANGLTAIDFSSATVVVAPPGLPNTGFPPKGPESTPWNIVALSAILATVLTVTVFVLKKTFAQIN